MTKALVLGSTGMLGSAVASELDKSNVEFSTASRTSGINFDAANPDLEDLCAKAKLSSGDYVINCIGLTKSRIDESSLDSRALAVALNVNFPQHLAEAAQSAGIKVIQVATDCVFSGGKGNYTESDSHDAHDVYGKTKSLGEVPSSSVMHLRCSLIGPEVGRNSLFFEWVRQQPLNSQIKGYTNHIWNGLSSKTFGRIVAGLIQKDGFRAGVQHLVPKDQVTKDQLVRLELKALGRDDVRVESIADLQPTDRTLATEHPDRNLELFRGAGYPELPTIAQMVEEICQELPN